MSKEGHIKTIIDSALYNSETCQNCDKRIFLPLTGGIINMVFQVCNPSGECHSSVLTFYPEDNLDRYNNLLIIMRLIETLKSVPLQHLEYANVYRVNELSCGVILKDFIPGRTVAKALEEKILTCDTFEKIIKQLGLALKNIHSLPAPHFGSLHSENGNNVTWDTFFLDRYEARLENILSANPKTTIGEVSIHMVQLLIPKMRELSNRYGKTLKNAKKPFVLHHDLHFLNIIINDKTDIGAILDWENATGGDPLFDLTFLEAQFFLSRHILPNGFNSFSDFASAYKSSLPYVENIQERRILYLIDCALSYFEALRFIDKQDVSDQIALYAKNHFTILSEICSGKNLSDIGICELLPYKEIEQGGNL